MRRSIVFAMAMMMAPALVSAQVEVGVDGGLQLMSYDVDGADNGTSISVPTSGVRVGFPAGETLLVETLLGFDWFSQGDFSSTGLMLVPGVNLLVGDQFYVRGEAGLQYDSFDDGTTDGSTTQYLFGGAAGLRSPLGDAAILRLEAGADKMLESEDGANDGAWVFRVIAGISAVVN